MSKAYICDCCGKPISNPYEAKMKEFYFGAEFDMCGVFPVKTKNIKKIHLCDDCFKNLKKIGKNQGKSLAMCVLCEAHDKRHIPKKVIRGTFTRRCPVCNYDLSAELQYPDAYYCARCGQALDWSDTE